MKSTFSRFAGHAILVATLGFLTATAGLHAQTKSSLHNPIEMIRDVCALNPDDPANQDHKTDPHIQLHQKLADRRAAILAHLDEYQKSLPKGAPPLPKGVAEAQKKLLPSPEYFATKVSETEVRQALILIHQQVKNMFYSPDLKLHIDYEDRLKSWQNMMDAVFGAPEPVIKDMFVQNIGTKDLPRSFTLRAMITLDELDCLLIEEYLQAQTPGKYKLFEY